MAVAGRGWWVVGSAVTKRYFWAGNIYDVYECVSASASASVKWQKEMEIVANTAKCE